MAKQTGLGMGLWVGGNDLSGDISALGNTHGGPAMLELTDITQFAPERAGGKRDGGIEASSWFNPTRAHPVLSALPTVDVQLSVRIGSTIGSPACSQISKQINYDGTRANDGSFPFAVAAQSNGFGLEWGELLTAGIRADTTATNGTANDYLAATSFGWRAYLHVFSFTGTSVTVTVQDSADNISFAGFTGSAFIAATGPTTQRLAGAAGSTVRRYVRVITTGTFSAASFGVIFVKTQAADVVF
jgi:hypothetical protein